MPIRFGLVGAGGIAQAWRAAFELTNEGALVAVADVDPNAATAFAEASGAEAYPSHRAMLDSCDIDAVIVATPPATHPNIVCELLESGIHVICEKPLAIDSHSARRMARAAKASGAVLTMASKFRFVADVAKARDLLLSGLIGEPVLFENAFTSYVDMGSRWNANPELSGGGVLIEVCAGGGHG